MSRTTEIDYVTESLSAYDRYWGRYIEYLRTWTDTHSDIAFCGCSPVCFDEWLNNENNED